MPGHATTKDGIIQFAIVAALVLIVLPVALAAIIGGAP